MTEPTEKTLKRFTSLAVAIDMLVRRRLTLLNPAKWDDQNDVAFLEAYRKQREIPKVFAMCFTQAPETFHHWSVFAGGLEGIRINIDKLALLSSLRTNPCYAWNDVMYRTLDKMASITAISVYDIPFLKRYAFRDELEFRLLYECVDPKAMFHHVPIELEWIQSVTVSPWMPENLFESAKVTIRKIEGCEKLSIKRTTLRENNRWKRATRRIVPEDAAQNPLPRNPINLDISLDSL